MWFSGALDTAASVDQMQAFVLLASSQCFSLPLHPIGGKFYTHPLYHALYSPSFPHDRGLWCLLNVLFHSPHIQVLPPLLTSVNIIHFLQPFPSINVFCFVLPPHHLTISSPHPQLLFHIHFQSHSSPRASHISLQHWFFLPLHGLLLPFIHSFFFLHNHSSYPVPIFSPPWKTYLLNY